MPNSRSEVLKTRLFITPFIYQNETEQLSEPDLVLHVGQKEAKMLSENCKIACPDMPSYFQFATELNKDTGKMHYNMLENKLGVFFPLFDSYHAVCELFGKNTHLAAVSFSTAQKICLREKLTGIVIGPDTSNIIIRHIDDTVSDN